MIARRQFIVTVDHDVHACCYIVLLVGSACVTAKTLNFNSIVNQPSVNSLQLRLHASKQAAHKHVQHGQVL